MGAYFGDAWSLAKRTAHGLNEIRKLVNIETKINDVSSTSTNFDTTGNTLPLTQMAQGTNYTANRIGNSIKLQNIEIRYRLFIGSSATRTVARVIVFRDLDGYGVAPTSNELLQVGGSVTTPLQPKAFLNAERFSILYDELFTMSVTGDSSFVRDLRIPHEGHVKYLGSSAAAASNGKGSVYILFVSDESTNTPSYSYHTRVYFTDD